MAETIDWVAALSALGRDGAGPPRLSSRSARSRRLPTTATPSPRRSTSSAIRQPSSGVSARAPTAGRAAARGRPGRVRRQPRGAAAAAGRRRRVHRRSRLRPRAAAQPPESRRRCTGLPGSAWSAGTATSPRSTRCSPRCSTTRPGAGSRTPAAAPRCRVRQTSRCAVPAADGTRPDGGGLPWATLPPGCRRRRPTTRRPCRSGCPARWPALADARSRNSRPTSWRARRWLRGQPQPLADPAHAGAGRRPRRAADRVPRRPWPGPGVPDGSRSIWSAARPVRQAPPGGDAVRRQPVDAGLGRRRTCI